MLNLAKNSNKYIKNFYMKTKLWTHIHILQKFLYIYMEMSHKNFYTFIILNKNYENRILTRIPHDLTQHWLY